MQQLDCRRKNGVPAVLASVKDFILDFLHTLPKDKLMNDKTVCYCINVSESTIVKAIKDGAASLRDIQQATGACTGNSCKELNPSGKCCSEDICSIIKRETGSEPQSAGCCCH
jgi:NAD(P)H-nitrite reductase large subunit